MPETFPGTDPKKEMTIEQAKEFVRENLFEISCQPPYDSRCVDGRYQPGEMAPLARAGADAGYLMTVAAAIRATGRIDKVDLREILEKVVVARGGPNKFCTHTDSGTVGKEREAGAPHVPCGGCGHVKHARKDPAAYGLTAEDIKVIDEVLQGIYDKNDKPEVAEKQEIVLAGGHGEGAVMIVHSKKHALKPMTKSGRQAFVYNADLDNAVLLDLATALQFPEENGPSETFLEALRKASGQQTGKTLEKLAEGSPLPVYHVHVDDETGTFEVRQ